MDRVPILATLLLFSALVPETAPGQEETQPEGEKSPVISTSSTESSSDGPPVSSEEAPDSPPPIKDPSSAKTPQGQAFLEGTRLAPRGTALNFALALGNVGSAGFSIGGRFSMGWRLGKFIGLALRGGAGAAENRSGSKGVYAHGDFTLPVSLGLCSHVPRVCPGLDLYVSAIPGMGYGYFNGNHAINGLLGLSIESVRTRGNLDVGVLASGFLYIDFLRDRKGPGGRDPWISYYVLELGVILRWGKG